MTEGSRPSSVKVCRRASTETAACFVVWATADGFAWPSMAAKERISTT